MAITNQDEISKMNKEELLTYLVREIQQGRVKTLGIYGHGASGKTTFTQELCARLDEEQFNLLETDPYIIADPRSSVVPKEALHQKVTACMPVAHELASLERDVRALQAGMDVLTIDKAWQPSTVLVGEKPVLIVEGMSVAFLPKDLFDLSICFYTDDQTELARRLKRDTTYRNREASWIERTHEERRSQYWRYYHHYVEEATILINQSGNDFQIENMQ